ncbi:hypothetical protein BKA93DRAFT_585584 [Sparassis latifolia]
MARLVANIKQLTENALEASSLEIAVHMNLSRRPYLISARDTTVANNRSCCTKKAYADRGRSHDASKYFCGHRSTICRAANPRADPQEPRAQVTSRQHEHRIPGLCTDKANRCRHRHPRRAVLLQAPIVRVSSLSRPTAPPIAASSPRCGTLLLWRYNRQPALTLLFCIPVCNLRVRRPSVLLVTRTCRARNVRSA